jgi:hypothetical protein
MIKGSFTSATGVIDIEFNDGLTPVTDMDITQIGELSYSFDITPESVTIDRLLALYSNFKFSFNGINQVGTDIYEAMVEKLVENNRTINLVITTHEGEAFTFGFECSINDLEIDERTGIASLLCKPRVADITFKDVFDQIGSGSIHNYSKQRLVSPNVNFSLYPATGVATWIKQALPMLFGNSFGVDFVSSKTGLSSAYSASVYDETPAVKSLPRDINMFVLLSMDSGFMPNDESDSVTEFTGTATIQWVNRSPNDPRLIILNPYIGVTGVGTNFNTANVGDQFYYYNGSNLVQTGIITRIDSDTSLRLSSLGANFNSSNVRVAFSKATFPNERPAIEVLKELAGIEGSVFGSGFSRNFYINRLADTQTPVELDYANVINAKLNRTSLYLGNSLVTQLGVQTTVVTTRVKKKRSFWDKLFGVQRFGTSTTPLPDDPYGTYPSSDGLGNVLTETEQQQRIANRQLPVLNRVTSGSFGNPRASKELRIELAPAYPLLSKGKFKRFEPNSADIFISENQFGDTSLESALTANGLRNYLRALSSVDGDFIIDFEIKGAFSLKPYETFQFTGAPERYQGNTYRVSEIKYNLLADTVKVKGYKINEFTPNIRPGSSLIESINVSTGVLNFDWDTTKPVINSVDVSATGVDGLLQVTCSSGFYSINTDPTDNLWRNSIALNTDGFGTVSQRIYVRFNPSATGIVSDSLLYGVLQVNGQSQTARTELRANVIAPQSEFYIGQVDGIPGGDTVSNITANMFTEIEQGREITLVGENKGNRYTITPTEDVFTGESTFAIEEQFIEKDRYHVEVSQNADRTGITVSEREIVLKVKSDGKIAAIRLSADADSATTEINIVADQVKINDINFVSNGGVPTANTGYVESNGYTAGVSGWRIGGTGNAEFGNVVARGQIVAESGSITGNLNIETNGVFQWDGGRLGNDGINLTYGGYLSNIGSGVNWSNTTNVISYIGSFDSEGTPSIQIGTASNFGKVLFGFGGGLDPSDRPQILRQEIVSPLLTSTGNTDVGAKLQVYGTTDSSNVATGSIITAGGAGVAKNVHIGGDLYAPKVGVTTITDAQSPYTVLATDSYIGVDNSANAVTVNLPAGTAGRKITIYDYAGTASLGTITIDADGAEEINGAGTTTLTTDYQSVTLLFTGGNWTII